MTANPLSADKNCTYRLLSWQYNSDMYPKTEELIGYYEETKTKPKQKEKHCRSLQTQRNKRFFLLSQGPQVHSTHRLVCCGISVVFIRPFSDNEYRLECATIVKKKKKG